MDDCVAVVDDREKLVPLSVETATEEVKLMSNLPSVLLHHKEEEDVVEPIGSSDQKQELSGESAGGGIIDKIISHFHEPAAPLQEVESRKGGESSIDHGGEQSISTTTSIQKQEIDGGAGGGGIVDKIMSHLHGFGETSAAAAAAAAAADQEEIVHSHDEQAQLQEVVGSNRKEQVTESNGGGLLNQIITNFPTVSIPDHVTSPKAEEASLLIHIVQD
ncbi:uncharacterized protein M6B38_318750 [Iris pallida]|uniref:Uncharacterized protein n=1 Tax=Iris pallida TaxID=29817 RepID=A0AAX6HCD0_IRIPA|nr:uncharacterized protein M6B38_318750 [Iris pallida]